jgi:hypothetical protein
LKNKRKETAMPTIPMLLSGEVKLHREVRRVTLEGLEMQRKGLIEKLLAHVPDNLARWKKVDGKRIVAELLEKGEAKGSYDYYDHGQTYFGFDDIEEFAQRFVPLMTAWKDVVQFNVTWRGKIGFDIIFTAV